MLRTLVICSLFLSVITPGYAASDLMGNWITADKKLRYDFMGGFAPNSGVVIKYENGKPKSIEKWEIRPGGISMGWGTSKYAIIDNLMILEENKFKKIPKETSSKIIELKRESQLFIDTLVKNYWLNPIAENIYEYKKAFSSTSGIYSITEEGKQGSLGSWSFANGVIKIDDNVYPNGRISGGYLFLLDSSNDIRILKRGEKAPTFQTMELKKKGKEFIRKLVSGRWMTPGYETPLYEEYRPIFGDLSGVIFNFSGSDYKGSTKWEYSLKTGSFKTGWTEYPNAQIQGPFLILLKEDGGTETSVRPKGEKIKEFTHAEIRRIKVTETDTDTLKTLTERQWYSQPNTYQFVFRKNGKEGWLHEFRSYPFIVSGNTLNIKGLTEIKDIRFIDGKIVFGDNQLSFYSDSKVVYLKHQGEEEAIKLATLQKQKIEESEKTKLVLIMKMKDGAKHRVVLPVGEMGNIISLSVEPGL